MVFTITNCLLAPSPAHQRGGSLPHLLRTPHLSHLQALLPQVVQVSSSCVPVPPAPSTTKGQRVLTLLSCPRACINQHLMNNKDCFFCKATITGVDDFTKPASS